MPLNLPTDYSFKKGFGSKLSNTEAPIGETCVNLVFLFSKKTNKSLNIFLSGYINYLNVFLCVDINNLFAFYYVYIYYLS